MKVGDKVRVVSMEDAPGDWELSIKDVVQVGNVLLIARIDEDMEFPYMTETGIAFKASELELVTD